MKSTTTEFPLSSQGIDALVRCVETYLNHYKVSSAERTKTLFKLEESLQFYREAFGESRTAELKLTTGLFKKITVFVEGEAKKPSGAVGDEYLESLKHMIGEYDGYQYKHNTNILEFKVPKKHFSQPIQILIAVALALLCSLLMGKMSADSVSFVKDSILTPVVDVIMNIIRGVASVLIFTSISLGIINIGDLKTFRKIGKSLLSSTGLLYLIIALLGIAVMLPWMHFASGTQTNFKEVFTDLFGVVLGVFPKDPLSPLIEGNALQIITLALAFGVIGAALGSRINAISRVAEELNLIMTKALESINTLLPGVVFLILLNALSGNSSSVFNDSATFLMLWLILLAALFILNCVLICIFGKINILTYFKGAKQALLTALFTASTVTAMPLNFDCCKKQFHIQNKIVDVELPIGQIVFMPADFLINFGTFVGVSYLAGLPISVSQLVVALFSATLLAIASPPVPGSLLITCTMLFSQLGLPESYLGVILAVICLVNFPGTMVNIQSLHTLLFKENQKEL